MQHSGERRMSLDPRRKQHTFRYIADLDNSADSALSLPLGHDDPNLPLRMADTRFRTPLGNEAAKHLTWGTGPSSPPKRRTLNDSPVQKHGAYHPERTHSPRGSPKPYDRMTHGKATVRGRDQYDVTFWDTRKKVHPPATRLDPTRRSSTGDLLDQGDYMYAPYRRPSPPKPVRPTKRTNSQAESMIFRPATSADGGLRSQDRVERIAALHRVTLYAQSLETSPRMLAALRFEHTDPLPPRQECKSEGVTESMHWPQPDPHEVQEAARRRHAAKREAAFGAGKPIALFNAHNPEGTTPPATRQARYGRRASGQAHTGAFAIGHR